MTRRSCHRLGCGAAVGAGNGGCCGSPSHSGCGRRMGSAWCAVGVGLLSAPARRGHDRVDVWARGSTLNRVRAVEPRWDENEPAAAGREAKLHQHRLLSDGVPQHPRPRPCVESRTESSAFNSNAAEVVQAVAKLRDGTGKKLRACRMADNRAVLRCGIHAARVSICGGSGFEGRGPCR